MMSINPMLCKTLEQTELPLFAKTCGKDWICQKKFDGDRILLLYENTKVKLQNRRGDDVTFRYPELHNFKFATDIILDGELVVFDAEGKTLFNEGISHRTHLKDEHKIKAGLVDYPVTFVIFDILKKGTTELASLPLKDRLEILNSIKFEHPNVKCATYDTCDKIMDAWANVVARGEEGLILKNIFSAYQFGKRSPAWLKCKFTKESDLWFEKFEMHPKGLTLENAAGTRVVCNGAQSEEVKQTLIKNGKVLVTIRYLEITKSGAYRMPTFMKLVR